MHRDTVKILDVLIDCIATADTEERLNELCNLKNSSIITTPNTEFLIKAQTNDQFKKILNSQSRLNIPDGMGLLWAGKFLTLKTPCTGILKKVLMILQWFGTIILLPITPSFFKKPIPERVTGVDFIWTIAKFAAKNHLKLFLLGGAPTVAERTALKLQTDIYDLRIAGVHSGNPEQSEEIVEAVKKSRVDILLVAFGAPKQELWLDEYLAKTGAKIGIGLGGTFDFIAGLKSRAPLWMQEAGLEWLYRLIIEPTRIKRQLSIPYFMWLVLVEKLKQS